MAALAWVFVRGVSTPTVAVLTATGITAGVLFWVTHCANRVNTNVYRIRLTVEGVAADVTTLREETECRREVQRVWSARRAALASVLATREGPDGR